MAGPTVHVDDNGVRRDLGNGQVEQVTWADLLEVFIVTTSDGPFAEDVFFILVGAGGAGLPSQQGAPECAQLLERLQRLPGFDNGAVIRAMKCTTNDKFLCWRRQAPRVDSP